MITILKRASAGHFAWPSSFVRTLGAVWLTLGSCALPAMAETCSDRLNELSAAQDMGIAARDASITSRRQAQDFKNTLLRSGTPDYDVMVTRLRERETEYQRQIGHLGALAAKTGRHGDIVAVLASERVKMAARYGEAVASLQPQDRASVFRADEMAKGTDVATFRQLEALVAAATRDLDGARKAAAEVCR